LLDAFLRSIPPGPSASLARRIRLVDLPAVRSSAPEAERLRTRFRGPGYGPFPPLPSRFEPHLRAAIRFVSHRACAPRSTLASHDTCAPYSASGRAVLRCSPKLRQRLGGTSVSQLAGAFASPNRSRMRFPEGTCTVSGPCKLLILLWFPAAEPSCLQLGWCHRTRVAQSRIRTFRPVKTVDNVEN